MRTESLLDIKTEEVVLSSDVDCVEEIVVNDSNEMDVTPETTACSTEVQTEITGPLFQCNHVNGGNEMEPDIIINQFVNDNAGLQYYPGCDSAMIVQHSSHTGPCC